MRRREPSLSPAPAATLGEREIEVGSPFVLLDLLPDSLYRSEARALSRLRGMRIADDDGVLQDVVLGAGWLIEELVIEDARGRRCMRPDGNLVFARGGRAGSPASGPRRSRAQLRPPGSRPSSPRG